MKSYIIYILLFFGTRTYAQEIVASLKSGKWYAINNSKTTIYTKKETAKNQESFEFKDGGKLIHCSMISESYLDPSGKEVTTTESFKCDSVWTYEIKNNMIKLRLLQQNPDFFNIRFLNGDFELIPIAEEEYNK